jgi:glutaredoxin 3
MRVLDIYTTRYCPYCKAAKDYLKRHGLAFNEFDIAANWELRDEMLKRAKGGATVPQIFDGDLHIGGYKELLEFDVAGTHDVSGPLKTDN